MAARLKLLLKSPHCVLLLKAAIFGGLLLLGGEILALLAALFFYARPIFRTFALLGYFLVLLVLSWTLFGLPLSQGFFVLLAADLSFLFYLILGLKNLIFVNRARWSYVLHVLFFYTVFILFFFSDKSNYFFLKSLGVFFISLLLFREFLKIEAVGFPRLRLLASWAMALIVMEMIWAISLLPIGFLNSANLAVLAVFVLSDLTSCHFKGTLNRRLIFSRAILFLLLALLIFATSKWTIT